MSTIMKISRISTENPITEQWRLLSQFAYPSNIRKFLSGRGATTCSDDNIELVAGSIRQSQAYFDAAATAPLDVSPLLLYYGATSLLTAIATMLTGTPPPIENHGMLIPESPASRLANVLVLPRNPTHGALQIFSNVFSDGCVLVGTDTWSLGEVIGSIPDLKQEFENHYQDLPYFTLPVEVIHAREGIIERIKNAEIQRYASPETAMGLIADISKAYLAPQYKSEYVILFRRRAAIEIGHHSITGRKYLSLGHTKRGKLISPHPLILMYMGLYVLGFLPRYRPHLWNPFVRSDTTGEKYIIEKFIAVCIRYLPNLALNSLMDSHLQFVNETEGLVDQTKTLTHDEIKKLVQDTVTEMQGDRKFL
jgi:hypothetical protein